MDGILDTNIVVFLLMVKTLLSHQMPLPTPVHLYIYTLENSQTLDLVLIVISLFLIP